jgi:acetoin utilization deacetylase AcuC-like enzyme
VLHLPEYVDAFMEGIEPLAMSQGWDWTPEIRDGVLAINRGQLTAAEIALEEGIAANVAQGFHHALYHEGMGYCTFNGLALVAQEHPDKKVFVLDCDEHGGNGTEDFIERLNNLRQITINGASFGCRNSDESRCVTLDPVSVDFVPYLDALDLSMRIIDDWKPDLVIYQAGADPHIDDPYGSLGMTTNQMRERDRYVFRALQERGIPVMFVLAGGYQKPIEEKLVPLHLNTFKEAADIFSVKKK